jgi:probable HAF family extracellular repeat protein
MKSSQALFRFSTVSALWCAVALAAPAQAATYAAKDIGSVAVGQCFLNEMNNKAQVVGACFDADGVNYTAYTTGAKGKLISTVGLLSGSWSWTNGLNDDGVLVGDATIAGDAASHAWVRQPGGTMVDLGTLGGANSYALNVSNAGLIVGISEFDATGALHGFVIQPGTTKMVDIGNLGGSGINVWEVNTSGVIAGSGQLKGDKQTRGFYANPPYTRFVVLPTFGGTVGNVSAINDSGVMVGYANMAGDTLARAFVAKVGSKVITELATPAGLSANARGINNLGQIVGSYRIAVDKTTRSAFTCSGTCSDFVDLNTVTTGLPKGVALRLAQDVSDSGFISAVGSDFRIYLLAPR